MPSCCHSEEPQRLPLLQLGIDGGSRNGFSILSYNCQLKHCSEAWCETSLKVLVRLKMQQQRKDNKNLMRNSSCTKAECSLRSWIKENSLKRHPHMYKRHVHTHRANIFKHQWKIFTLLFLLQVLYFWVWIALKRAVSFLATAYYFWHLLEYFLMVLLLVF